MKNMSTKSQIFMAATNVIREKGVAFMTLEAVAKGANISKGGLLYHFPDKEALIDGLVDYYNEIFYDEIESELSKFENDRKGFLRAYINVAFTTESPAREVSRGLLAALLLNSQSLKKVEKELESIQHEIEKSVSDFSLATILRLAADGLWFSDLLSLNTISAEKRAMIHNTMLKLVDEMD